MDKQFIKAIDIAKKFNLYLKVVTSVETFDNYNSFFNIFSQEDKPCRRILVLTPYEELEEVYENKPNEAIIEGTIVHRSMWLKEFSLTINPKNINLNEIVISKKAVNNYINEFINHI